MMTYAATAQYVNNTPDAYYQRGYVYMKNGSVLKGRYQYSSDMEKLRVISGKNTWIFEAAEIDHISRLKPYQLPVRDSASLFPVTVMSPSKWFNLTELGVLKGNSDNSQPAPLVFSSSFNRQIYRNLSAGAGIGVEFLKETYLPVSVNLLYKLDKNRFTPFGMIQAGYQIPIENSRSLYREIMPTNYDYYSSIYYYNQTLEVKARGGFLVNPSVGFMRQTGRGPGISMAVGYRFHRLGYTGEEDYRLDIDYYRFSVKLGIILN